MSFPEMTGPIPNCRDTNLPMPWEQARQHAIIQASERVQVGRIAGIRSPLLINFAPRSSRCFAWICRLEASAVSFVLVNGDPGSVYPGMTAEILVRDPTAINKFFPEACATQMAECISDVIDGKLNDPFELLWKSAPAAKHDLCVVVTIQEVLRYANSDGDTICLAIGHTADLTSLIRDHEAETLDVEQQVEQPSIERWISDMVTQDHEPQEARQLGQSRTLSNPCRDKRLLLSTEPMDLNSLLSQPFVHGFVWEQSAQTVQFLAEKELLPPDLLAL